MKNGDKIGIPFAVRIRMDLDIQNIVECIILLYHRCARYDKGVISMINRIIFFTALLFFHQTVWPQGAKTITITPASPSTADSVFITCAGEETAGMSKFIKTLTINYDTININITIRLGMSGAMDPWETVDTLAPLAQGSYTVHLKVYYEFVVPQTQHTYKDFQVLTTGVEHRSGIIPQNAKLEQNYPNPFNPTTHISFSIKESNYTTLRVFNVLGNKVATLVSENLPRGTYIREWNALNFSSGIYFYQLKSGNYTETKKLIVLK